MNKKYLFVILFLLIFVFIYRNWFSNGVILGGDFPFFYDNYSILAFPYAWSVLGNYGIGGYSVPFLWSYAPIAIPVILLGYVKSWFLIERIGILFPYLVISLTASWYGFGKIYKENSSRFIASLIFLFNTPILMLVGGGLPLIALGISLLPLIFGLFKSINKINSIKTIFLGLLLGIQITLDLRVAFLTEIILLTYLLVFIKDKRDLISNFVRNLVFPGIIAILINTYWIFPMLIIGRSPIDLVGNNYTGVKILEFLSFTKFENAISLLHPNWPENIFGKVSFLQPEFLILPILAFCAFLFLNKESKDIKKLVIFAGCISLIGIFMAKGINPPFGQIFEFFYKYVPGFQMFRDSSKWFVLIAFGYSILIPFTISKFIEFKKHLKFVILTLFTIYFIFLLRPAFTNQLTKMFLTTNIPSDYFKFKDFIKNQKMFFRTAWYPTYSPAVYGSSENIALPLNELFKVYSINELTKKVSINEIFLEQRSVKFIAIPDDFQSQIFLSNRKYDEKKYQQAIKYLENIQWLKKVAKFGKIVVFEVPNPKDHFWSPNSNLKISYKYINPTKYLVSVENAKKGDLLIFSESYDSKWQIKGLGFTVWSSKFDSFDSFSLPKAGTYNFEVYYTPQDFVNIGTVISIVSLLGFVLVLIYKK